MTSIRTIINELICDYYNGIIHQDVINQLTKSTFYSNNELYKKYFENDLLFYMYLHLEEEYHLNPSIDLIQLNDSSDFSILMKDIEMIEKEQLKLKKPFMKTFSYHVCKAVMHTLIEIKKSATTLDVKNILRNMGYVATQEHVSETMDAICGGTISPYTYMANGKFRIYTFLNTNPTTVPVTQVSKDNNKKVKSETKKTKVTKKTKTKIETLFVVFEKDSNSKEKNFKSYYAENRDAARKKYSNNTGIPYYRVRARLHGNPATTTK